MRAPYILYDPVLYRVIDPDQNPDPDHDPDLDPENDVENDFDRDLDRNHENDCDPENDLAIGLLPCSVAIEFIFHALSQS